MNRPSFTGQHGLAGFADGWPIQPPETGHWTDKLRGARRLVLVVVWTLVAGIIQAVMLLLPGAGKVRFARFYWATVARLLGIRVRRIGQELATEGDAARPVMFVANHSSWLDIIVLGSTLPACFVAKGEIARWPGISVVAKLGRTIFVSRKRNTLSGEREAMRSRLERGDNLLLFPEGTSSDGVRVLPFLSAFFVLAEASNDQSRPLIQAVSVAYDRVANLPAYRESRALFAWYGDMDLLPHAWTVAQQRGLRATVLLHPAIEPAAIGGRKALANTLWKMVADGAAALRQGRPGGINPGGINPGGNKPRGE